MDIPSSSNWLDALKSFQLDKANRFLSSNGKLLVAAAFDEVAGRGPETIKIGEDISLAFPHPLVFSAISLDQMTHTAMLNLRLNGSVSNPAQLSAQIMRIIAIYSQGFHYRTIFDTRFVKVDLANGVSLALHGIYNVGRGKSMNNCEVSLNVGERVVYSVDNKTLGIDHRPEVKLFNAGEPEVENHAALLESLIGYLQLVSPYDDSLESMDALSIRSSNPSQPTN